jgi:hypothetical protein
MLTGKENITAGNISTFMRYSHSLIYIYSSCKNLLKQIGLTEEAVTLEKVYEIMDYKPKITNLTGEKITNLKGKIEFIDVHF